MDVCPDVFGGLWAVGSDSCVLSVLVVIGMVFAIVRRCLLMGCLVDLLLCCFVR